MRVGGDKLKVECAVDDDEGESLWEVANFFHTSGNEEQAFQWYLKASEKNHTKSQYSLGLMYHEGCGTAENAGEAFFWFSKASARGHIGALHNLGMCYFYGKGTPQNLEEAHKYISQAAKAGFANSQHCLSLFKTKGLGCSPDPYTALDLMSSSASQGFTQSQVFLGLHFLNLNDPSSAFRWFLLAAKQDHGFACFEVGESFCYGRGVRKNLCEARWWYSRSADCGSLEGAVEFGHFLENGVGGDVDERLAFLQYTRASNANNIIGHYETGRCHWYGFGTVYNPSHAFDFLQKVMTGNSRPRLSVRHANSLYVSTTYLLGLSLKRGVGTKRNFSRAQRWLLFASTYGHTDAQFELGELLLLKGNKIGKIWLKKASNSLDEKSVNLRRDVV